MAERELAPAGAALPEPARRPGAPSASLRPLRRPARWPWYVLGGILALYVLIFARGLAWQWQAIIMGARVAAPTGETGQLQPNSAERANLANTAGAPAQPAQPGTRRVPLPASDEPPPRDARDKYGVYYDAQGIAVMGIIAEPGGVFNVPAGRQVRIGGPAGELFDVRPGGQLTLATSVKEWPQ